MSKRRISLEQDGRDGTWAGKEYNENGQFVAWVTRRSTNRDDVVKDLEALDVVRRLNKE